jgi:uncharacterized protein YuzE
MRSFLLMATVNSAYLMFENTMKQVIDAWEMEGRVSVHYDFCHYLIGILFVFTHRYLSIKDIINYNPDTDKKEILDSTVRHLREIKMQFYAYFNAIWC